MNSPSPINIRQLQQDLLFHNYNQYVDYLIQGFLHGFDTKVSVINIPIKECKNLLSAVKQKVIVQELIEKEVQKGFLSGPYDTLPFDSYRVSPIGIAEGKYSHKKRLMVDLSSPHDSEIHQSINNLIDKEECSLSYVTIDDAIRHIIECGRGAWMCKADISDAFKLIPTCISPSQYHLFCIKWCDAYYFYTKLAFGCRSSPKIFDEFSKAICWIAENKYGIARILHLLDDFLTIDAPNVDRNRTMALLTMIFNKLNVPLAKHKTMGPLKVIEYLGITLDSDKMEARLPEEKVNHISKLLDTFMVKKSCTKRELLQLLGHLNFATRVIIPGRTFVSYLLTLATSAKELEHWVHLNSDCREDLRMWKMFLDQWNCVSLFHKTTITVASDMELYTDASSTMGFGGFFRRSWFCDKWPSDLPNEGDEKLSMAFRELFPIVIAAILWGKYWSTKRIKYYCDNFLFCFGDSQSLILLAPEILAIIIFNNFSQIKHFII